MNYCDEQMETPESSADILPKKTNFYELRKVTFPIIVSVMRAVIVAVVVLVVVVYVLSYFYISRCLVC